MRGDGHLTQLDTAFSRDQERKIYVQDLMTENARQLWRWLEDKAFIYVCGDATRMAKDVDRTLHKIVEEQGGMPPEAAESYVQALKENAAISATSIESLLATHDGVTAEIIDPIRSAGWRRTGRWHSALVSAARADS